jgi:hypothetical protein
MQRVQELIKSNYFKVSQYNTGKNDSNILYSQGNNVCLVQIDPPSPIGHSDPLRITISVKPKSSDNIIKISEREVKMKSILENFINMENYSGAQMKINLILLQESQNDVFSTLVNGCLFGLLKVGIQMKSTFFAFELFSKGNNQVSVFNGGKVGVRNQVILVIDVVNDLVGNFICYFCFFFVNFFYFFINFILFFITFFLLFFTLFYFFYYIFINL